MPLEYGGTRDLSPQERAEREMRRKRKERLVNTQKGRNQPRGQNFQRPARYPSLAIALGMGRGGGFGRNK